MNTFKLILTVCALFASHLINAQYCTPTFQTSGNCGTLMSFTTTGADVNLNYISNDANLKPNAVMGNRIEAVPNQELTLNLYITTFWAFAHFYADMDGNGQFEQSEIIGIFGDLTSDRKYHNESTGVQCKVEGLAPTFTVPLVAHGSIIRFRVICGNTSVDGATPDPCTGWREGSYMDFELLVKNPVLELITLNPSTGGSYTITDQTGTSIASNTSVAVGSRLTVNASPQEGYQLKAIKVNGTVIEGNQFTFDGESTVEVIFTDDLLISLPTPDNFSLVVKDKNNNTLTNGDVFAKGQNLTCTFVPTEGYEITELAVNGTDQLSQLINNVLTLSDCNTNVTLTATASKKRYSVAFNNPVSGTGTLTVRNETTSANLATGDKVSHGDSVVITASASTISTLTSLKINGIERKGDLVADKLTVKVSENLTIEASFLATEYTLNYSTVGNGGGTIQAFNTNEEDSEVASGSKVVKSHYLFLEIHPNAGSSIVSITNNGTEIDLTEENGDIEKYADRWVLWFDMNGDISFEVTLSDPSSVSEIDNDIAVVFNADTKQLSIPTGTKATIFDVNGKKVRTITKPLSSLSELPNGVYFVKVNRHNTMKTIKIVKR